MKKVANKFVNGRNMTDQKVKDLEEISQMMDDIAVVTVQVISKYLMDHYPDIEVERVEGVGLDTVMYLSIKYSDYIKSIQFAIENYMLEFFTIDRDETPLRWDEQVFSDPGYQRHKANTILMGKMRLLVLLAQSKSKKEVEECMKILYSTGSYERIRCQIEKPR